MITSIFDLDGTLYTGHILHGIARHHWIHRVKRLPLLAYFVTHLPLWLPWRLGILSETTVRELSARHIGWLARGWTPKEATRAFAWVAEQYVEPLLCHDVVARLRDHQEAGHRVIIVSGTLSPLLAEIGRRLEVEETVGTPLVLRNGRYTGAVELPVCQGANKVLRLETYRGDKGNLDWSQSYAYADSHVDLPQLARAGHPIAVYPDALLAAHARSQGWEVLSRETADAN